MEDHLNITRPDQLQALGDPTRWRILGRLLEGPATVQELARALGVAKGTVAHHVRVLDRAGLIRVAETKRMRGVVEKRYARVAGRFRLDEGDGSTSPRRRQPELANLPLRQAMAEASLPRRYPDDPSMSFVVRARMPVGACSALREAAQGARCRVRRWRAGGGRDVRVRRRHLRARLGPEKRGSQLMSLEILDFSGSFMRGA